MNLIIHVFPPVVSIMSLISPSWPLTGLGNGKHFYNTLLSPVIIVKVPTTSTACCLCTDDTEQSR